jgi:signal transduction histidine kinase
LGDVVATGQPLIVPDTANNPRWVTLPDTAWIRSHLVAPLRMKRLITGFISVSSRTPNLYTEAQAPRLQALADQAAVALENAMLFEQLRTGRQQLQDLSQRLLEVQETERRLIARELHDEIGQALTGLKLFLEADHRGLPGAPHDKLGIARSLVEDLISRVRDLSLELRPTMLDDLGLVPALVWLFERYQSQTGIRVSFQHFGLDRRFAPDLETAAYRIVQEALTNVARHAAVETATVNLWADEATLNVQVEDGGTGFDPHQARSSNPSTGLAGMRERATLLHGQLTIETAPGAGTQITAELPLRQANGLKEPVRL